MERSRALAGSDLIGLVIATLGGAAVGIERERSGHAEGIRARFAGIRTFTMLGALGGLTGWLWNLGVTIPAVVLLGGAVGITVAAYNTASRQDVDGTTEVAALIVLAAGVVAGIGSHQLASGIIALTCLLLIEKSRLHALVARIDDIGLRAGARFAVMALVVLPLLPEGPYGPLGGVRPRQLWALVLFFSGLSFLGYVARRLLGSSQGYLVAGLLGGLVSSTNVTFTFARSSRVEPAADRALAFGAIAASAVLYPRVLLAVAVLNLSMLPATLRYLAAPALVAIVATVIGTRQSWRSRAPASTITNPLQLETALQMGLLFQAMLMFVKLAGELGGAAGVIGSAAIFGLTDVDALTVSMAKGVAATASPATAALAIAIGVLSNTTLKLAVALFLGSPAFRRITGGILLLVIIAAVAALLI